MDKNKLYNRGVGYVWLRGSHKYVKRNVYQTCEDKCFIEWYGQMIEVTRHEGTIYYTVEQY